MPGSIGASFQGPGAYWALLGPTVQLRRTYYDVEKAAARVRATAYPQAEQFAATSILEPPTEEATLKLFANAAHEVRAGLKSRPYVRLRPLQNSIRKPICPSRPGQHLRRPAKRLERHVLPAAHRRGILAVEQVEELEQHLRPDARRDVEALGEPHVEIDERRRGERVAPGVDVDARSPTRRRPDPPARRSPAAG